MRIFLIAVLGMTGVLSRYGIQILVARWGRGEFPIATLLINIVGSFLIGILYVMSAEKGLLSENMRVALIVGLLGGFTTFSSFSMEALTLIQRGTPMMAFLYIFLSISVGILAASLGMKVSTLLG